MSHYSDDALSMEPTLDLVAMAAIVRELLAGGPVRLAEYRSQARSPEAAATLHTYLAARADGIPNYQARRRSRQYIGSGLVDKANDRIVTRRQKGRGMQWSARTSDG